MVISPSAFFGLPYNRMSVFPTDIAFSCDCSWTTCSQQRCIFYFAVKSIVPDLKQCHLARQWKTTERSTIQPYHMTVAFTVTPHMASGDAARARAAAESIVLFSKSDCRETPFEKLLYNT